MKLPDFLEFQPFNALREKMGAEALGEFALFDPQIHLTADELAILNERGLVIAPASLCQLRDFTVVFKNSRVALHVEDTVVDSQGLDADRYHLAWCERLARLHQQQPDILLRAFTHPARVAQRKVCEHCLQRVHYRGIGGARQRHRGYQQRIIEDFDLAEFFRRFPPYPLEPEQDAQPWQR